MDKRTVISCPYCNQSLRLPVGKFGNVVCRACSKSFKADTRSEGERNESTFVTLVRHLLVGVFGFLELFGEFCKRPKSFCEICTTDKSLKQAAALYLASGVITYFSLSQINSRFEHVFGEPAPFAAAYGAATSPVVGELIQAIYGILFLVVMIPAALILRSSRPGRTFNEMMFFFFSMGSVGAFIYSAGTFFGSIFGMSAENPEQLITAYSVSTIVPSVATLIFIPFYAINLKKFAVNRSWGRVLGAFLASLVAAIPFQMLFTAVIILLA